MTTLENPVNELCGLLVVDKPLGWSSMDVIRKVRWAAKMKRVGHAGTLDPLATGVVVVCLGKATKSVESLMGMTKVYEARIDFSAFTSTDDAEGPRQEVVVESPPKVETLRTSIARFIGEVDQTPPMYSAIHIDGERAYKLARRGEEVVMPSRRVRIDGIELLTYAWPTAEIRVTCGKGTYIRSLARDIGKSMGTGGHLTGLRRLSVGIYDLSRSIAGERIAQGISQLDLLPAPAKN